MKFEDIPSVDEGFERRHWMRFSLPAGIRISLMAQDKRYQAVVTEVSLGGARIHFEGGMPPPASYTLEHDASGEFRSECKWCTEGEMGLEFDQTEPSLLLVSHCLRQTIPEPKYSAA